MIWVLGDLSVVIRYRRHPPRHPKPNNKGKTCIILKTNDWHTYCLVSRQDDHPGEIMKTIQYCVPFALLFAIACDDTQSTIDVNDEANASRANDEARVASAERAGYLVKTTQVIARVTQNNSLIGNPQSQLNCDEDISISLETLDSECENMPEEGYIATLTNCDMGNGDTFDAELIVSAHGLADSPLFMLGNEISPQIVLTGLPAYFTEIRVETDSGTNIQACGSVSRKIFRQNANYIVTIDTPEGSWATYELRSQTSNHLESYSREHAQLNLIDTSNLGAEIEAMEISSRRSSSAALLPQRGMARISGPESGRLFFRDNLSQNNSVIYRGSSRYSNVVEIPTL